MLIREDGGVELPEYLYNDNLVGHQGGAHHNVLIGLAADQPRHLIALVDEQRGAALLQGSRGEQGVGGWIRSSMPISERSARIDPKGRMDWSESKNKGPRSGTPSRLPPRGK